MNAGYKAYVLVTRCTSKEFEVRFVDGSRKGQTANCLIAYCSAKNLIWPSSDVTSALKQEGIRYIDNRGTGGALWALGGRELAEFLSLLKPLGYTFVFKEQGGKASEWKPAWYLA